MVSLLSYGEVLVDFLPSLVERGGYLPLAGGAPANVAVAFAKLGGKSYFAGGISADNLGQHLLAELNSLGVNSSYVNIVEHANTAIVLVSLDADGERSFSFYRQQTADTQYPKESIEQINWANIGIFHFCSNTLTDKQMFDNTLYAIEKARAVNTLISFDVNLRQQLWSDLSLLPERVLACIQQSDVIKLSKDEALYLAELDNLNIEQYVAKLLKFGDKLVLITDGANAIQAICGNYTLSVEVPAIKAVDTTAAGDSFIASFLFYLSQHISVNEIDPILDMSTQYVISDAINFAAKCGALTCLKKGAFAALPLIGDVK